MKDTSGISSLLLENSEIVFLTSLFYLMNLMTSHLTDFPREAEVLVNHPRYPRSPQNPLGALKPSSPTSDLS